jgi:glutathione S-transferase
MAIEYVNVHDATERRGLRMVVVGRVPSPWGEAAKGILHLKRIDWVAVRLDYESEALKTWAGQLSGPIAVYEDQRPRAGWAEILLLCERLAPEPALLPGDPAERALVFGLSHELCGEAGLAWTRRLQLVHAGLRGTGGFPERVARYIGKKYGYRAGEAESYGPRVTELLRSFTQRLKAQREAGSCYYVGKTLTAVDFYGAACCALFSPLPAPECEMDASARVAFETLDAETTAALDPILVEHRDMMYARHLELPLSL